MSINFNKLKSHLLMDGAMGTMITKLGIYYDNIIEELNVEQGDCISKIHELYIDSGSNIITTNTFGANSYKLEMSKYSLEDIISNAVLNAKKAVNNSGKNIYIAQDIGPIGRLIEPSGDMSFNEAYELFKEQVLLGEKYGVDLYIVETLIDIGEARAAVLAVKENSNKPVICTMTFEENKRTLTGTDPITFVNIIENLGVDAIGVNCSLGPKELHPIVSDICRYSQIPVVIQPNAGLPKIKNGDTYYELSKEDFCKETLELLKLGVQIVGGCCGTTPDFIKEIKKNINAIKYISPQNHGYTLVSSSSNTVEIGNDIIVIGERLNPTGKKRLSKALKELDLDYIVNEAIKQKESGAQILDVNTSVGGIDEKEVLTTVIKELQESLDTPLQIDSSNVEAIESALRHYNGRAIINSVNGKEESLNSILPLAKKYGALVVGLTMDEKGIPENKEERISIAQKIISFAKIYGIKEKDIIIDTLVLTASAQQKDVMDTLNALREIKEKCKAKTTLGVSNVSFGLPNRMILNKTFLAMAIANGLDLPILNTFNNDVMDTVNAARVLKAYDRDSEEYINTYKAETDKYTPVNKNGSNLPEDLIEIILKGLKESANTKTKELLDSGMNPLAIVNDYLIKALDKVGDGFEKNKIFLPQLIRSAETVKIAFEEIRKSMINKGIEAEFKGKVALATVKGDVHDIGKNIVKVLLQNYGYEVIDLGKDVDIDKVVETCKKYELKMVGLSALMTSTVENMKKTIEKIREEELDCKVLVGGAVLTEDYAKEIGADFYAKDAMDTVRIANEIFSK